MFLIGFHLKHDCKFPLVGMAQPKFTFPILNIKDYAVDKLAEALLGSEFPGVVPLAVQGSGNCLFRAASLIALGNEGHHAQLRSMVVSDLREHAALYADHFMNRAECVRASDDTLSLESLLSQALSKAATQTFLSGFSGGLSLHDVFMKGIQHESVMSTKPGTWSGMLQLAAVASVFCRPVRVVYPKTFDLATQKYMDTVYQPRITDCHEANPVTIMRSSTRSEWKNLRPHPKHFVPCVCVSNICSPDIVISSYALVRHQDEVGWETQGRKKAQTTSEIANKISIKEKNHQKSKSV